MVTGRAVHHADNGDKTDITEGVQALYDLVISSMDWGSGFWTADDAVPVALVGRLLGFKKIDEVERYIADHRHASEAANWRLAHIREIMTPENQARSLVSGIGDLRGLLGQQAPVLPHDHVFSSVGRCMWPRCQEIAP